jgi:hypothetical protein
MHEIGASPFFETLDGIICPVIKMCRSYDKNLMDLGIDFGKGGSDKKCHVGFKILSVINSHNLISGFLISSANTEERSLAESLFRFRNNPNEEAPSGIEMDFILGDTEKKGKRSIRVGLTSPVVMAGAGFPPACPYLGDAGYRGKKWNEMWLNTYGVKLITSEDFTKYDKFKKEVSSDILKRLRQNVETMQSHLTEEFKLWYPKGRTFAGLIARIGAKYLIQNICTAMNIKNEMKPFSIRKFNPFLM